VAARSRDRASLSAREDDRASLPLRIRITKRGDGGAVLQCVRADGSATWQRHEGRQAAFFPRHDLTHYAVESALGCRRAFFGLVAAGWEIDETTGKGARGPLPPEAILVEHLVGLLEVERATSGAWSAADFVEQLRAAIPDVLAATGVSITDALLSRLRTRREELLARWSAIVAGETLELELAPGRASP
jgi:hypothetical protein